MASGHDTILVVMANEALAQAIEKHLGQNGHDVTVVTDEASADVLARRILPALILVDRRLRVIEALRCNPVLHRIPIVSVAPPEAGCSEDECVVDLEEGADLAICSPSHRELIAKVRAILRREHMDKLPKSQYVAGGLRLDVTRHEVTVNGRLVELTPKEFQILQQLIQDPSRVFSRDELLNRVWGEGCALEEHTLDVHIHSLRHKIEADPAHHHFIVTVRGIGYKLKSD